MAMFILIYKKYTLQYDKCTKLKGQTQIGKNIFLTRAILIFLCLNFYFINLAAFLAIFSQDIFSIESYFETVVSMARCVPKHHFYLILLLP